MEQRTAAWIARAAGGEILCGDENTWVTDICTDSRKAKAGDLYVPILGAQVDGHRFIGGALAAGAAASFTSEHDSEEEALEAACGSGGVLIRVADTRAALQRLGQECRRELAIPFVGVTGSVGKTSTRSMIALALSGGLRTFQTSGNANSQVGVPITLSQVGRDAEAAVIELGVSDPGEMTRIASIAGLKVAVITNIGISHIAQLGSREGILREKLHITDGLSEDGILLLNGDDDLLYPAGTGTESERAGAEAGTEQAGTGGKAGSAAEALASCTKKYRTYYYGLGAHNDYRADEVRVENGQTVFVLHTSGGERRGTLPVIGLHHVRNALAAIACADLLGVSMEKAADALAGFAGVAHRQEWISLPALGLSVIDDSYNASPDSMRAAFTTLQMAENAGRKLAVLADMWELGPETERYHYEVGQSLGTTDVSVLVTVGELAKEIARGAQDAKPQMEIYSFEDRFAAGQWLKQHRREGDLILFKGSNGMRLFEIVEEWKKALLT